MNMQARPIVKEMFESVGWLVNILVTSVQGMLITGKYFVRPNEIVTVRYPREKLNVPENFRGRLLNDPERCISCELCARACPTKCITVKHEMGADKKRILTEYSLDMTACLFCGLCTEACPETTKNAKGKKCLIFVNDYEYSSDSKEQIKYYFKQTEDGLARKRKDAEERVKKAAEAKKKSEEAKSAAAAIASTKINIAEESK